jgi:hypothetical protein
MRIIIYVPLYLWTSFSTEVNKEWSYTFASTIRLHGVFRDDLSFQWVPVLCIEGTASGVGVGQLSQSRAEIDSGQSCICTAPTPSSHGQRQVVTSLYFDKYTSWRRMFQ